MNLKTWLGRQRPDPSPMGRLISHAVWSVDPEEVLIAISRGTDPVLGREYRALAQGLVGQFKREGGKFKHPSRFERVKAGPDIKGDVIAFRPKPAVESAHPGDVFWTRFYAALCGIEIGEDPVEFDTQSRSGPAEVTVFMPDRNKRQRKYG